MMLSRGMAVLAAAAFVGAPLHAQRRGGARRPARAAASVVIPTPRAVLGFDPGDDRKLVEWPVLLRYFQAVAKASDRVDYRELGNTTLGGPVIQVAVSSQQNLPRQG